MKIIELVGWQMPINNEEADLLDKFEHSTIIEHTDLDPRQQLLAGQLVNKDVLLRRNQNGKITYIKKT